jgi:hypothetical protein
MPGKSRLTPKQIETLRDARANGASFRTAGALVGVSSTTVMRALSRTRTANEFKSSAATWVRPPQRSAGTYSWSLESIRGARDSQMRGMFRSPVRLAEAMRTDDALFSAYHNRIAPHNAIATRLSPCSGTRGAAVARKAAQSCAVSRSVLAGALGTMANHGVAIGYNEHEPSDDGTRVDFKLTEWPLEYVTWNTWTETLETQTRDGSIVPIVHGDGRWVVFRKFLNAPWTQEAALLPGSLIWAAHANGVGDWAGASKSHGQASVIGELPEGVALRDANGLTAEASAFLTMLQDVISGGAGAGLRPFGSKTDVLANASTAWQVFLELIVNREKAAARIYLGTDAMLGSVGGAPGVDIATLFGVATTKVQGDFEAIEQALASGFYAPWTAINVGDSSYAPALEYLMPDTDSKAKADENAAKRSALLDAIKRMREEQMTVDQAVVDKLAASYGVDPVPILAEATARTISLTLAPTDVARVTTVNEARASQGLPPLTDARGALFISELEGYAQAKADIAVDDAAPAPAPAPAPVPAP